MLRANWPSQSLPPPPSKYTLMHIDTNSVHNATVCRFRQKRHLFGDILPWQFAKKLLPVCFFADKVVGNIHQIYSISFKEVPLKLQGLLKLKHFDSQATNCGPVLPNSRKRLRNFCHSIGQIKIVLFLRLVLKQHDELKDCSKYTAVA